MQKTLLLILALIFDLSGKSQENSSGTIVYEQVVKLEIKLEGDASQFADMLPKERKTKKVLYFNPESSLFENGNENDDDAMSMSSGGGSMVIKIEESENKVYTDINSKKQVEQREFMSRVFLIEGETDHQWKLTGKQKMILDFPCQEATLEKDSTKMIAWFTPVIPVSAGPANYGGLPGLILSVESENGKNTTIASSVDFSTFDSKLISKPNKGKKVTREEFDKIVEEKMKEMGAEGVKGGHQMMIRIQR